MKRAWPYALALAVVVTGCYLALAPLLRSLSPAPTSSATSQLSQDKNTVTVGKPPVLGKVVINRGQINTSTFVSNNKTTTKKKTKKVKKPTAPVTTPTTTPSDQSFAGNPPSSSSSGGSNSSSSGSSSSTPKTPAKAPAKTTPRKSSSVGGNVVQSPNGDSGLAGGNSSGTSDLGQKPDVGG